MTYSLYLPFFGDVYERVVERANVKVVLRRLDIKMS